tara:strand:- start:2127 stop:4235 length:2109 start_codon:yes stop_codon:yes gene_type:complete
MQSCTNRNPSPPCKVGSEERDRIHNGKKLGRCCFRIKNFDKKKNKKTALVKTPSIPHFEALQAAKSPSAAAVPFFDSTEDDKKGKKAKNSPKTNLRVKFNDIHNKLIEAVKKEPNNLQFLLKKAIADLKSLSSIEDKKDVMAKQQDKTKEAVVVKKVDNKTKDTAVVKKVDDKTSKKSSCNKVNPPPPCAPGYYKKMKTAYWGRTECCYKLGKTALKKFEKYEKAAALAHPLSSKSYTPKNVKLVKVSKSSIKSKKASSSKVPKIIKTSLKKLKKGTPKFIKLLKNKGFSRVKYLQNRLTVSYKGLKEAGKGNGQKLLFWGTPDQFWVVDALKPPPMEPQEKFKKIASGTYNTIWRPGNTNYAYRINTKPMTDSADIEEAYNEGMLTIRLSELGIAPRIHDYYFAAYTSSSWAIQVSEFSKHGSLHDYMKKNFKNHGSGKASKEVISLANETVKLYQRMVDNYIFCTDVKPPNMIVTNQMHVKLIDFDNTFCASKESPHKRNIDTILKEIKSESKYSHWTKKQVLDGFYAINILQIVAFIDQWLDSNTDVNQFKSILIDTLTINHLKCAAACAQVDVGGNEPMRTLKHYSGYPTLGNSTISEATTDESYIGILFLLLKKGAKVMNDSLFLRLQKGGYIRLWNKKHSKGRHLEIKQSQNDHGIYWIKTDKEKGTPYTDNAPYEDFPLDMSISHVERIVFPKKK